MDTPAVDIGDSVGKLFPVHLSLAIHFLNIHLVFRYRLAFVVIQVVQFSYTIAGMQQIQNLLHALRVKLGNNSNELRVMNQLFNNVQFQDAVALYNQVNTEGRCVPPLTANLPEFVEPRIFII